MVLLKGKQKVLNNIDILKIYFCPHNEKDHCHCKKPKPGMIEQAKKDFPERLMTIEPAKRIH